MDGSHLGLCLWRRCQSGLDVRDPRRYSLAYRKGHSGRSGAGWRDGEHGFRCRYGIYDRPQMAVECMHDAKGLPKQIRSQYVVHMNGQPREKLLPGRFGKTDDLDTADLVVLS